MNTDPYYQRRRCSPMTVVSFTFNNKIIIHIITINVLVSRFPFKRSAAWETRNVFCVDAVGLSVSQCNCNHLSKKAMLSQGNRAMPQLFFSVKVRRQHSLQASKVMLQSSKHSGEKQNLTQNGHSRSFEVTCFGVSWNAIRDSIHSNTKY